MNFKDFKNYIFNKYPKLESFGWTQYTPYFNDGNETYFHANIDYLFINDEWVEESEWISEKNIINWGTWNNKLSIVEGKVEVENPKWDPILSEAHNEILEFLRQFDNDFYLEKFGNDAKVKITKDGIKISDYDHE